MLLLGATSAMAGEITGNGKDLPVNGKSICAYSGLNDELTDMEPTRTQSYGTFLVLVKGMYGLEAAKAILPSPGVACNPNSDFEE
jgi:hypothetical protein